MTLKTPKILGLAVLASLFASTPVVAKEGPKIGIALAGGAARGFAHVGVIKVLEEVNMPVDVITGTSMGSVVGGLWAAGYTAAEMESLAVNVDWLTIIAQDVDRRTLGMEQKRWTDRYLATMGLEGWNIKLPSGLRSGQELMSLYREFVYPYQDIEDLPIQSAFVAQDLVTGDATRFDHGDLVDAVRASMSIPWVFSPAVIDGKVFGDGGMARNLPAEDAQDLGADIVIGVDVGPTPHDKEDLETMFNVLTQTALLNLQKETKRQQKFCDLLIVPDLVGMGLADFDKVEEFIARGEEAARAMLPQLQALADSLNQIDSPTQRDPRPMVDTIEVTGMTVTGLDLVTERVVRADMGIEYPATITLTDIEKGIDRLYGSGLFEWVNYRIDGPPDRKTLNLVVLEKSRNLFRMGLRFDTRTQGSLLLNTTFRNLLFHGSTLTLDLRLARDFLFEARHTIHTGLLRSLGVLTQLHAARANFDVYEDNVQVATYRSTYAFGAITLGTIFSTSAAVGVGIRPEYIDSEPTIGAGTFPSELDKQMPIEVGALVDTYDRTIYPTTGAQIQILAEHSFENIGNNPSFTRVYVDGRSVIPLSRRMALLLNLYFGTTDGEIPFVYNFALGGIYAPWTFLGLPNSFMGLKAQQRIGPHTQAATLGVQYEPLTNIVTQLRWSVGNTFNDKGIKFESGRYINGIGVTFGLRVLNGRAEVTFSTSEVEDFLTHITIGSAF